MSEQVVNPIPAPPEGITDSEQIAGGEERWTECPLKDCKRNPELLYSDFYLRSIRSNRLMCTACVVRAPTGYMAREEARQHDDKFFQGTQLDNARTFGIMLVASVIANIIASFIPFFYFAFLIGGAAGGFAAPLARRLSGGRSTREQHYIGAGGIIIGAIIALYIPIGFLTPLDMIACSAGLGMTAWGVLQRKI